MTDFLALAQRIISIALTSAEVVFIGWMASGGVIYLLRGISFWLDTTIVSFIGAIYSYFMDLLKGELFNSNVVNAVLQNVYVFIGVFVFFRIAMLVIKYIINPELLADSKIGASQLIKRVIIGAIGIILTPWIFDIAMDLQSSILEDQIVQQLIIPKDMINATLGNINSGGDKIGSLIFSGFISPRAGASDKIKTEYEQALKKGDLSVIDFNSGGFLGVGYSEYDYSYFFFISTFILGYTLYLMLKYCLDIVVRFFKLFLYQMLAPIAIIEYMVAGSDDGVFKSWKTAVISTYLMLFVRVLAIWFVVFVMTLMTDDFPRYASGSLLRTNDYLLKALILIGLLGFMMDLPKLIGQIFGLDLEQESSATGVLKSIGGIVQGIGMGALAAGGAALGGAVGSLGAIQKGGLKSFINRHNAIKNARTSPDGEKFSRREAKSLIKSDLHAQNVGDVAQSGRAIFGAAKGSLAGMWTSFAGATAIGKAISGGYNNANNAASGYKQKQETKESKQATEAQAQIQANISANIAELAKQFDFQGTVDLATRLKDSEGLTGDVLANRVADIQAGIAMGTPQAMNHVSNLSAQIRSETLSDFDEIGDSSTAIKTVRQSLQITGMDNEHIENAVNYVQQIYNDGGKIKMGDAESIIKESYKTEFRPNAERASKLV